MAYKPATLFFDTPLEAVEWYIANTSKGLSDDAIVSVVRDLNVWGLTRVSGVDSEGFCADCDYDLQIN